MMIDHNSTQTKLFEELVQSGSHMMSAHDENGVFTYVNAACFDVVGYTVEELLGRPIFEFFHPEEMEYHGTEVKGKIESGQKAIPTFSRFRKKNGTYVWFQAVLQIKRDKDGSVKEILNSAFDITPWVELKEQMQEKETILDEGGKMAKVGAWRLNLVDGKVVWTPPVYELYEWEEKEPPSYDEIMAMCHDGEKLDAIVKESIKTGNGYDITLSITTAKGNIKWLRTVAKTKMLDNQVVGLIGVVQDVTEVKEKEKALQNSLEKLKIRTQKLEDFNHIVSHNLRSPVANMVTLINLLRDTQLEDQKGVILSHLEDTANNLQGQLNELMDIVDIVHGYNQEIELVNLNDAIDSTLTCLKGEILKQEVSVTTSLNWDSIKYSKHYLDSIVLNLVSNAIKYSSNKRKPVVEILAEIEDNRKVLYVKDNGLGIDLDTYGNKLFKLRSQVHRERKGNGVGLFYIKEQIEALGGEISVESKVDQGTTFKVCFKHE